MTEKLTTAQAAELAAVDVETIVFWADQGKFTAWNITKKDTPGRRVLRIDRESLEAFLESRLLRPTPVVLVPHRCRGRLPVGMRRLVG